MAADGYSIFGKSSVSATRADVSVHFCTSCDRGQIHGSGRYTGGREVGPSATVAPPAASVSTEGRCLRIRLL
jgi:hypothetical protein